MSKDHEDAQQVRELTAAYDEARRDQIRESWMLTPEERVLRHEKALQLARELARVRDAR